LETVGGVEEATIMAVVMDIVKIEGMEDRRKDTRHKGTNSKDILHNKDMDRKHVCARLSRPQETD